MTSLLGVKIDATDYAAACSQILHWTSAKESRYVCVANSHVIMEAHDSSEFRAAVNAADMVTPDGMPLVWVLRLEGYNLPDRVYGPSLMRVLLHEAARRAIPIGFYGSTAGVVDRLGRVSVERNPGLDVAFQHSPPFRDLSSAEDQEICRQINQSGARLLFVGLGCPKQEKWMAAHRGRIQAVMIGVGAAFDFLAGTKPQAPMWMQAAGLEWLFRLAHEPRRLWKRYIIQNPRFAFLATAELLRSRRT